MAPDWTLHDLRRTYRTNLSRLKVPPHIAERLLNHTSARDPLEFVYDQYDFMDEKREAVEKYDAWFSRAVHCEYRALPLVHLENQDRASLGRP